MNTQNRHPLHDAHVHVMRAPGSAPRCIEGRYGFVVTRCSDGQQFDNLVGVFAREFPLATMEAVRGATRLVGHYGTNYTIAPRH